MQTLRRVRVMMISVLCTLALTCKKEPPPAVYIPTLALTAVDASCTEAWLKLTTTQLPATVRLVRLTPTLHTVQTLQLTTPDTLLIDEGLLPRRTYTYKAYGLEVRGSGFEVVDSSTQATVTTMDTTSHNFTWQIDTLGTHSSVLYDVAIINDTLVYAVGEIFHRDSSENWTFFNLAKWNGREWTLHRVYYNGGIFTARWILAFSENDIWIEELIHWNGTTFQPRPIDPMFYGVRTTKAWGTSSSDFYVVGNGGFIAHYDGVRWRRIESGTSTHINDAWGVVNPIKGEREVYCPVTSFFTPGDKKILKITNQTHVDSIPWQPQRNIYSLWSRTGVPIYVCGSTLHVRRGGQWWEVNYGASLALNAIRGEDLNNIFVVGDFGIISHFNGVHWQIVGYDFDSVYGSVAVARDIMIAVGTKNARGIITIGRRL